MKKDFDGWNENKKRIGAVMSKQGPFPKEGWVWMCSVGINIGFEQNGSEDSFERPALVVRKFNNQMYWVMPLSTKQKPFDFYYNFTDPTGNKVSVIIAQLRLLSIKRFIRDMYRVEELHMENIRAQTKGFLEKSEPRTRRGSSRPKGTL